MSEPGIAWPALTVMMLIELKNMFYAEKRLILNL
jgi:hypothetical protein